MNTTSFQINRLEFIDAITSAIAVVPTRLSFPILSTIMLTARDGSLQLSANNLDSSITVSRAASIDTPGAFCLAAHRLRDAATRMHGDGLSFCAASKAVTVSDGNGSRLAFASLPAEEFPPEMPFSDAVDVDFDRGELADALRATLPFASTEKSWYVINSVFFDGDGRALTLVATNNRILRFFRLDKTTKCAAIVPARAAEIMASLSSEAPARLSLGENMARLSGEGWSFQAKLIEGQYADWRRIVPKEDGKYVAEADRAALLESIRLGTVVEQSFPTIKLSAYKDSLRLSVTGNDGNDSEITVSGSKCTFKESVGVNPKYLTTGISSFSGERITICTETPSTPLTIRDENGVAVISPIRVQ